MTAMGSRLAQVILAAAAGGDLQVAVGVVAQVSPVRVSWLGGTYDVTGRCRGYTPALNDVVLMIRFSDQTVVVDALDAP